MVQGFYTLQEAARHLNLTPEEMRKKAEEKGLRGFFDKGTYRYRSQDIHELAREMGGTSEPELVLGDAIPLAGGSSPRTGLTPHSGARRSSLGPKSDPKNAPPSSGRGRASVPEVFDFDLGLDEPASKVSSASKKSQIKPPASGPRRSQFKPGSESEIRLVSEGDDLSFSVSKTPPPKTPVSKMQPPQPDSSVRLGQDSASKRRTGMTPGKPPATPPVKNKSKLSNNSQLQDSGMRLVPIDNSPGIPSSSDEIPLGETPLSSAGDSDVRLERHKEQAAGDAGMIQTEEINLDEELRAQADQFPSKPGAKIRAKSNLVFPTSSPFEISDGDSGSSEFDLNPNASGSGTTDFELTPAGAAPNDSNFPVDGSLDGSSNFSLSGDADSSGDIQLPGEDAASGSSDFSLTSQADGSSDFDLGATGETAGADDFSLELPNDPLAPTPNDSFAGADLGDMSLELSADDLQQYDHNVDSGLGGGEDMSLDLGPEAYQQPGQFDDSGSQFAQDSGFELTLDDGGRIAQDEQVKPQGEHIFDSDFEVPGDESGSEILSLDPEPGDESNSEFKIALDDADASSDDESASQVIALDDDEQTLDGDIQELSEGGFGELDGEGMEQELPLEEELEPQVVEKFVEPAPWGIVPTLVMIPCVAIMFLVVLLAFEMVQSAGGVNTPPGPLTRTLEKLMGIKS